MAAMTIDDVLKLAVEQEIQAAGMYLDLANMVGREDVKETLLGLAQQEDAHRESLERVREGDLGLFARTWPEQNALVFSSAPPEITPDSKPQEVVLAAMEAERQAFLLYSAMAEETEDPGLKTLLGALAREETHHWESLEKVYDKLTGLG